MTEPGPAGHPLAPGGPAPRRVALRPGIAAVVLTGLGLLLAWQAIHLLVLLFIAVLIAVYLVAFTDAIAFRTGWGSAGALAAALVATLLALWGIEALLVPPVIEQTRQLAENLPRYAAAWQDWLSRLVVEFPALDPFVGGDRQRDVVGAILEQAQAMAAGIFPRVVNVLHGLINVASVAVMAIYLARTPALYSNFVIALVPPAHRDVARRVLTDCGIALRQWVFAQLFNMAVLGALTALGLWALGVPYWLAFGIFSGIAAIVPFFGVLLATILPALFVLDRGALPVMLVLALGVVVHVIEGNVVAPMVFQRGVHLPPVLTIMAVLVVGTVVGPAGLIVAVPLLAVILVLVRRILQERIYRDRPDPVVAALRPAPGDPVAAPPGASAAN
ncbi:MAG TPA: AI-2E family transporter [Gemmatimonadaceae bacterium]|nr:AI-2E family transporter [Gemmatimonadaceae bacterium]